MYLTLEHINFKYPNGKQALSDVSLSIEKNKNVAFLGANGSGKSSLFLVLAGLLKPFSGSYTLNDKTIGWKRNERRFMSENIGLVFQDPDVQILTSTVQKEIAYGPSNLSLSKNEIEIRIAEALHTCDIEDLRNESPHSLSFGQKKSVAIASILAMKTNVIVFDEPLAWLDPLHKEAMMETLGQLKQAGKTVLVSTHNTDFAYQWADEIYVLDKGEVICHGSPDEVFAQTEKIQQAHLSKPLAFEISQLTGQTIKTETDILQYIHNNKTDKK